MEIAQRLKEARKNHNESQNDIAALLQTTQHQISKYESGKQEIPAYRLGILCKHWGISADYILGIKDIKEHPDKYIVKGPYRPSTSGTLKATAKAGTKDSLVRAIKIEK